MSTVVSVSFSLRTKLPLRTIGANPTVGNPGDNIIVTVTITDCNGNGLSGILVVFTQASGPANCQLVFDPPQAVTDANGQVHTTVTLPGGCPCQYTINATAATVGIVLTTTVPPLKTAACPLPAPSDRLHASSARVPRRMAGAGAGGDGGRPRRLRHLANPDTPELGP